MVPERIASLFRRRRIDTLDLLADFVRGEASRVAQVSLLGHLRGRMGTQWPVHFRDPAFAPVIELAQQAGFRICLADLAVFAAADVGAGAAGARRVFVAVAGEDADVLGRVLAGFDWSGPAEAAFRTSQRTLLDVAPVGDAYKAEDREAFANALELRWTEVRRRFRARADRTALARALAA